MNGPFDVRPLPCLRKIASAACRGPSCSRWARLAGLLIAAACFVGCGEPTITSYRAPKEKHPDVSASQTKPHGHGGMSRPQASLQWKLPAGWKESAPGQMSIAAFTIAGKDGGEAQVNITVLPNLAGHDADIVNMWRQQIGLAPLTEEEATRGLRPVEVGGETGRMFEAPPASDDSKPKTRIVTAIVHRADGSWFYKLTGGTPIVENQKPVFIEFLKSIRIQTVTPAAAAPMPAAAPPPAADAAPALKWKVPPQWTPIAAGQMQLARFAVPQRGDARAAVSVSVFPSDTGGALANVNRWRQQIGLDPIADTELPKQITALNPPNPQAFLTEQQNNKKQIVAAVVPRNGQWFFYKLLGDAAAVAPEKDAFVAFVKSEP